MVVKKKLGLGGYHFSLNAVFSHILVSHGNGISGYVKEQSKKYFSDKISAGVLLKSLTSFHQNAQMTNINVCNKICLD